MLFNAFNVFSFSSGCMVLRGKGLFVFLKFGARWNLTDAGYGFLR